MLLASEAIGPLVLSATTVALDSKARNEFAAKEPIWVRFTLENTGDSKVTVWLYGMGEYGVHIEAAKDSKSKVRTIERLELPDIMFIPKTFEPKEKMTFDVLLVDFIDFTGEGAVNLQATLGLDAELRPIHQVKTAFSFTLKGQLDKKRLDVLLKSVEALYDSDSKADRYRAVDSARAIRVPEVLPLLAKAIVDKDEILQSHAVQSLAVLPYPEVIPILEKALESTDPAVRGAANYELVRRKKAAQPAPPAAPPAAAPKASPPK